MMPRGAVPAWAAPAAALCAAGAVRLYSWWTRGGAGAGSSPPLPPPPPATPHPVSSRARGEDEIFEGVNLGRLGKPWGVRQRWLTRGAGGGGSQRS